MGEEEVGVDACVLPLAALEGGQTSGWLACGCAGAGQARGDQSESLHPMHGCTGGDWESSLRPVERYAVRLVEAAAPAPDPAALSAELQREYRVAEFDLTDMEQAETARDEEIDADAEQNVVAEWDVGAASLAYAEQVQAAQEEEEARQAAEAAWLEASSGGLCEKGGLLLLEARGFGAV